ncbi:MAG TPA: metal-dependent phosphohydrolase [Micromonosporaceae bacterium]
MSDLLQRWRDALPPSAPAAAGSRYGQELLARWQEPHRYYHTEHHLAAVLTVIDEHADWAHDPTAVRLAAWFHDAVYLPQRVDNEEASALLAEAWLPDLRLGGDLVAEVARLVRLTASHDPMPGDRNGGLLSDADLAILAAPAETYRWYSHAIRREYAHLPDAVFAGGRAAVLENLLSLPRLFHTPVLRDRFEDAARRNLSRELTALRDNTLPYAPI